MGKEIRALFAALLLTATSAAAASAAGLLQESKHQRSEDKYRARLANQVRHQLVMLPWYSVFDNLAFRIDRDKVTLLGQVTRPVLKSVVSRGVASFARIVSKKRCITPRRQLRFGATGGKCAARFLSPLRQCAACLLRPPERGCRWRPEPQRHFL